MNQLFVGCSSLEHCSGMGHAILAADFIREPHWTCLGLQDLDCAIRGVPRLSPSQEHVLDRMRHESRTEPATDEEREAVERMTHSLSVQRQFSDGVYFRDLGSKVGIVPDTLELSLESGLSELSTLSRLRSIKLRSVDHRLGMKDLSWMVDA
ncbi:hypothetical protein BGX29_006359 [Mortierella sp. GBA35]|nr:hypothetical protein BGX29_006359 [Mortierella sp. GBA35]